MHIKLSRLVACVSNDSETRGYCFVFNRIINLQVVIAMKIKKQTGAFVNIEK